MPSTIGPHPEEAAKQPSRRTLDGGAAAIERGLAEIKFDTDGLVPAIAQQHDTGEILMVAWMNRDAVLATLAEGRACYWSRSRGRLWRKGETSGQVQALKEMRLDCDGDTVLLLVDQTGVACHTGRRNCFFRAWRDGAWVEIAAPLVAPEELYKASV
jgi:phosphoribosyl-AMP cyclohydrolase